jgi:hypothetical protein
MKVSWTNQQTRNFQAQCVCMCVGCGLAADRQFETVKSSHNPELVFRSGCVGGLPALKRATVITKWRNNASQNVSFVLDCVTIQNLILNYLTGNPIFNFFFICFYCVEKLTLSQLRFHFCYKDKDACPVWTGSIFLSASWRFIWLFFSRRLCHSAFQKSIRLLLSGLPQGRNQSVLCNVLRCIAMQLDLFRWRQSPYQRHQVNERSFTAGQSLCQRPRFMCVCAFSITGSGEEQKPCATIRFKRLVPDAGNDFLMHLLILLRHGRVVVVNAQHTDVGV